MTHWYDIYIIVCYEISFELDVFVCRKIIYVHAGNVQYVYRCYL